MERYGISKEQEQVIDTFNFYFTAIFAVEMLIKFTGLGIKSTFFLFQFLEYMRDPMNNIDGVVTVISIIEISF